MKSILALCSIAGGEETIVLNTEAHIEAPNWTPDDATLIVNGGGALYRVALANPGLHPIHTGFATRINNDHGISPDGTRLVISDATEVGQSRLYTLPIGGGAPSRVIDAAPSYWHGWSPDGRNLAYVGRRSDTFQVFTCPMEGGEEIPITQGFDHCDGPDYTPDGNWIWFNGEIDGSVQLWRVRPDGSGQEQMTSDDRVNWFPHPSPDGAHVAYLAYEPGTQGHPAEKTVELRLMPSKGGPPRTLRSLFGGQGTINVPSWSPDSRHFAYVRYEI